MSTDIINENQEISSEPTPRFAYIQVKAHAGEGIQTVYVGENTSTTTASTMLRDAGTVSVGCQVKNGYVFKAWLNKWGNPIVNAPQDFIFEVTAGTDNLHEFTATAAALPTYTVSYITNSSASISSQSFPTGSGVYIASAPSPKKNYTLTLNFQDDITPSTTKTFDCSFSHWSGSNGYSYNAGQYYSNNSNLTLTAVWTDPKAENLPEPSRSGYNFDGWYTAASGGSKITSTSTISSSQTIYAHWSLKTYTISYDANGGTGAPANQIKTYGKPLDLDFTGVTRSGYEFLGWAEDPDATEPLYKEGASYTKEEAKTLYAVWKKKGATIYYGKENTWIEAKAFYGNSTWKEIVLSYGKDGVWKQ